jgi:hypothetical protein
VGELVSPRTIRIFLYIVAGIVVAGATMAKRAAAERMLQSETRVVAEQNNALQLAW